MAQNRGKDFENVVKSCFERDGFCIDRLHDQTTGFIGSANICDFIVYKYPNIMYLECKSCRGNTFPLSNITDKQFSGLLEKSKYPGVFPGVMIWWIDKDVTRYIPITDIEQLKLDEAKSIRFDTELGLEIPATKKRVFFDYHIQRFWRKLYDTAKY